MKPKVLIVDDEANVRVSLRRELSVLDCEVLEAGTPDEAKGLLTHHLHEIRVVILDLRLVATEEKEGDESGLRFFKEQLVSSEACLDCRRRLFTPSVIILTAWPNVLSCRAAFLAGALDYLDKNDDNVWEVLVRRVSQALEHPMGKTLTEARKWAEDHSDELLRKYSGQTVALDGEQVVESASNLDELKTKLGNRRLRPEDFLLIMVCRE